MHAYTIPMYVYVALSYMYIAEVADNVDLTSQDKWPFSCAYVKALWRPMHDVLVGYHFIFIALHIGSMFLWKLKTLKNLEIKNALI
jgi:hypothetical protein